MALRWAAGTRWAVLWLVVIAATGLLAPRLPLPSPLVTEPAASLQSPSAAHWLGTDLLGRDVLSRMAWGVRRTLLAALVAIAISAVVGTAAGMTAGYLGGWVDDWLMRCLEVALALPPLLLALILISALGPGQVSVGVAVGLANVAGFARLVRAAVLQVRGQLYVQAAEALGASRPRILAQHILRNTAPALASFTAVYFAWSILNGAALTFLGFGGNPAVPDWGMMLNEGRAYLLSAPWLSAAPGLAITLSVLAVNALAAGGSQIRSVSH